MAASEVQGIDLFKIADRSISGWVPSLKTGTVIRQPFCSQLEERLLLWLEYHPLVANYACGDIDPEFATKYRLPIPQHAPFAIGYTLDTHRSIGVTSHLCPPSENGGCFLLTKAKESLHAKAIVELDGHLRRNMRSETSEQDIVRVQTHISFVGWTVHKAIRGQKGRQHAAVSSACQSQTNGVPVPGEAKAHQDQVFDSFCLKHER